MIGRLVAALGRRSRTRHRLTLAAVALLVLLAVASALAPTPTPHRAHRPMSPVAGRARTDPTPTTPAARPVSSGGLVAPRRVAARFLAGYLPFLYGCGSARSIDAVTPDLRLQLSRMRRLITPVERQRHPRVVSLTAVAQSPAAILATALIADGGVTTYPLRITLRSSPVGWLVSTVDGG